MSLKLLDVEFMWINPEKILPVKNRKSYKSEAIKSDTFLMTALWLLNINQISCRHFWIDPERIEFSRQLQRKVINFSYTHASDLLYTQPCQPALTLFFFFAELEAGLPTSLSVDAHTTDEISISFHIHNFFLLFFKFFHSFYCCHSQVMLLTIKMHFRVLSTKFYFSSRHHQHNNSEVTILYFSAWNKLWKIFFM